MGNDGDPLNRLAVNGRTFQTAGELLGFVVQASRYMLLWRKVGRTLASAPAFDYVGSKSKLEHFYTTRMTHEIDRRFVEFVEKSRTTAKTLDGVIKAKQRFPLDAFEGLKEAFPSGKEGRGPGRPKAVLERKGGERRHRPQPGLLD